MIISPFVETSISPTGTTIIPSRIKRNVLAWFDAAKRLPVSYALNQFVINGNFANGATGWAAVGATQTAESNILTLIGDGGSSIPRTTISTGLPCVTGKKIYASAKMRVTNSNCTNMPLAVVGSTGGSISINQVPVINQWHTVTGILTLTSGVTGNINIKVSHEYLDAATANGKVMEVQEVIAIDLTTIFGAGAEPTAAEMDAILSADGTTYWDGSRNVIVNPSYKYFWDDYSANARIAKLNNFAWSTSSGWNNGLVFDAVDDSMKMLQHSTINDITRLSVVGVAKINGAGGGTAGRIFDKTGSTATNGRNLVINATNVCLQFVQLFSSGNVVWVTPNNSVVYGKTFMFAVVYDNSSNANNPTIYINAIPQALIKTDNASSGSPASDAAYDLYVGNRSDSGRALNGAVKQIAFFNKLLTAAEIRQIFTTNRNRFGI